MQIHLQIAILQIFINFSQFLLKSNTQFHPKLITFDRHQLFTINYHCAKSQANQQIFLPQNSKFWTFSNWHQS